MWWRRQLGLEGRCLRPPLWSSRKAGDSKGQKGADPNTEQTNGTAPIPRTGNVKVISGASSCALWVLSVCLLFSVLCFGFLVRGPGLVPAFSRLARWVPGLSRSFLFPSSFFSVAGDDSWTRPFVGGRQGHFEQVSDNYAVVENIGQLHVEFDFTVTDGF